MSEHLMHNYTRLPVTFTHGDGVRLFDANGKSYLDALAGIAVCGLGYNNAKLNSVLAAQASQIWHTSNCFEIPGQDSAANKICAVSGMDRAFFCNSGTEANEAAIKITRLHAREKNIANPIILSFTHSFHGRTFGAMAATANPHIREHFEPHVQGFEYLPYNDLESVKAYRDNHNVVAVMVEAIQGEGGVYSANIEFLQGLRELCDANDWLLVCDEVQSGMMRSGKWFSFQRAGIIPDLMTLAKGLGNGIPVGACVGKGKAAEYIKPGYHGTTFGGTPLVMAVVNAVLDLYTEDGFEAHVSHISDYLQNKLRELLSGNTKIAAIRGIGMMIGIELKVPEEDFVQKALEAGVVLNVTAKKVIRLLPPLIYKESDCDELASKIVDLLA